MDYKEKNEFMLAQVIFMFQATAFQQMGKIKNPISDKIEQNLDQAQVSIDILDMLHDKMKGNLSQEEEKMFSMILQDLKLNYVDEINKKKNEPPTDSNVEQQPKV